MKFLNLLILSLCFCACATNSHIQNSTKMHKNTIPVFMTNGEQYSALKTTITIKNKIYNCLLLANKKESYINFKLIGDFATILLSVNLRENTFEYESSSPLLSNPKMIQALEELLLALFAPGTTTKQKPKITITKNKNLKHIYYFDKGETSPFKLKQKGQTTKTFLFENYKGNLPKKISVKTKFNTVKINFELLAHR